MARERLRLEGLRKHLWAAAEPSAPLAILRVGLGKGSERIQSPGPRTGRPGVS